MRIPACWPRRGRSSPSTSFGDSALQFSLRVYLADISQALGVQSDLRIAMLKALREAGIEIPFNQVDVNLRDLDAVKRYLAQYLQERAGKAPDTAQPNAAAAGNGKRVPGAESEQCHPGACPRDLAQHLIPVTAPLACTAR